MPFLESYESVVHRVLHASQSAKVPKSVTLIAVSKGHPVEAIEELYHFGQRDFGENYVQELELKARTLLDKKYLDIRWHFMGHLQTNKVKLLIPFVSFIHTLDSIKLAREIAKQCSIQKRLKRLPVFVEVNLAAEETKSGISSGELSPFFRELESFPDLQIKGLMCIPPISAQPRLYFQQLEQLEKQLQPASGGCLSMGMSNDFEIAINEGATHVRVGTAIFGAR